MQTILITGGTSGTGLALAENFLKQGAQVITVGHSVANGQIFLTKAQQLDAANRATFIQADLSLMQDNQRLATTLTEKFDHLDMVILAAAYQRFQATPSYTREKNEFVFSLMYLSRYYLSYHLVKLLLAAENPAIINIAAPGMQGKINWSDLQFKQQYDSMAVKFQSSRLNDLLGVQFSIDHPEISYLLFNPWAVKTKNALTVYPQAWRNWGLKIIYRLIGKTPQQVAAILLTVIQQQQQGGLRAYKLAKTVDLSLPTFDKQAAKRLAQMTREILS